MLWTIANNIIVFGGYGRESNGKYAPLEYLNDTFHLNTRTMKWNQLTTTGTPPSPRDSCAHAQCAGKGFLFAGHHYNGNNNDLHMFDLISHVWTELKPNLGYNPHARGSSQMIVRGTDLIIFGGIGDDLKVLSDCWAWSIEKKTWRELKDYDFDARHSHTACYMSNDSVLIVGGSNKFYGGDALGPGRFLFV